MILLMDIPTALNLPYWIIGMLVLAVGFLFKSLLANMREAQDERKAIQLKLDTERSLQNAKIDALYTESLDDQKKMAILLNDNIQLIQSLTRNTDEK